MKEVINIGRPKKLWLWNNEYVTIDELSAKIGVAIPTIYARLKRGMTLHQIANNKPVHHGMKGTRLYRIYYTMINRCYNKNDKLHYPQYGAKGITVCDEWINDNTTFFDWAISHGYADNLTIDRIDNNKGYSPDNCRWSIAYEQTKNKTNTIDITYKGETKTLNDWCKELQLNYRCIHNRIINLGWDIDDAFTTPVNTKVAREKLIENKLRNWLKSIGIYAIGLAKQHKQVEQIGYHHKVFNGGYMCVAGVPDLSITVNAIDIRIECKSETGLLSAQQKVILRQILDSGGYGFILTPHNFESVKMFISAVAYHDDKTRNAMYQVLASQTYELINSKTRGG